MFVARRTSVASRHVCFARENHGLDEGEEFLKKEVTVRKEYTTENRLSCACLEPGHLSRPCTRRKTCEVWGRLHPIPFHGDYKRQDERASSTIDSSINTDQPSQCDSATVRGSGQGDSHTSSMIVPVWVYHKENSGHKVLVYALLDDQSDTTFVDEDAMNQLGIQGHQTQLLLSAMHAKDQSFKTQKVNGLFVEDFGREVVIPLPKTFSLPMIPARREQIARPKAALKWSHTKQIAERLMPYREDMRVDLLIGSDCPRVIVPREVITGSCNDPYALRTELGWGMVGKVESCSEDDDDVFGVINRIVTREVAVVGSGDERKFCHFTLETKAKEIINPFQIKEVFEMDFSEKSVDNDKLSQDDKTFLQRMEQGIHQRTDGHYEMPLPFREGPPHLPNNKPFAICRLQRPAQRFERDKKY